MSTIANNILVLYYPSITKEANLLPPHRLSQKHNLQQHQQRQQPTRLQKAKHKKHQEMQMLRLPTSLRLMNELSHYAVLLDEKSGVCMSLDLMKST